MTTPTQETTAVYYDPYDFEIDTNPYGSGFSAGIIAVRALYSVDVGVRLPIAFSRASSIT